MICTSMYLHHVNSLRLVEVCRGNGLSLTVLLERGDMAHGIPEERLEIVIFAKSEAEFDLLSSALPRADNFKERTLPPKESVAA